MKDVLAYVEYDPQRARARRCAGPRRRRCAAARSRSRSPRGSAAATTRACEEYTYLDAPELMRILSWNVNGLRACGAKGFRRWLDRSGAEIVGVQEVRARARGPAAAALRAPRLARRTSRRRRGAATAASGSSRAARPTRSTPRSAGGASTPRAGSSSRASAASSSPTSTSRTATARSATTRASPTSSRFYRALFERLEKLRADGAHVLVMGDFNTAHQEIDLARPRENRSTSGFLPGRAARARALARGRLGRHLPRLRARPRPLLLVEPARRRAREERRLAHRLRARLARSDALRAWRASSSRT